MKKFSIILFLVCFIAVAKDVTETQSIDGSQRNQITVSPGGSGGGSGTLTTVNTVGTGSNAVNAVTASTLTLKTFLPGANTTITDNGTSLTFASTGGGGSTITNTANNWSDVNTFNSSTFTSNLFVRGYLGVNTNGPLSSFEHFVLPAPGQTLNAFNLLSFGAANYAFYQWGDTTGGKPYGSLGTEGTANTRMDISGSGGNFYTRVNGEQQFILTESTYVLGNNSSDAFTANGATFTFAHSPIINGGVLNIPVAGGTITNNTSFTSFNTITASNMVTTTTDGTSYLNSGTNLLMRIIVNASAGTLQTEGLFTTRTNTLTVALPVINTIYTNNALRLNLNIGVNLPTGLSTDSAAAIWTVSGVQTNTIGMCFSSPGVNSVVTNTCVGLIQPNALYMVTNINTGAGAPSIAQGLWNETRF